MNTPSAHDTAGWRVLPTGTGMSCGWAIPGASALGPLKTTAEAHPQPAPADDPRTLFDKNVGGPWAARDLANHARLVAARRAAPRPRCRRARGRASRARARSPVSRTSRSTPSRTCATSTMFAPAAATRASSRASPPGRSATRVRRTSRRPARSRGGGRPRRAARHRRSRPTARRPSCRSGDARPPPSSAASDTAPAPSTTSFERSTSSTIASAMSSSRRHDPVELLVEQREVISPGCLIAMPSAIVSAESPPPARPLKRLRVRPHRDLHADHLDLGPRGLDRDRHARASPPPPTGTTTLARSGTSSSSSSPSPGLAGDDVRVVERVTNARPASCARLGATSTHSSTDSPPCTSRPSAPPRSSSGASPA